MPTKDELELKKHLEDSANRFEELSRKEGMEERYIQFCIEQANKQRKALKSLFPPKESTVIKM